MKRLKHMIALLSMALLLCAGTSQAVVMAASSEQSSEDETATSSEQDAEDEAVPELALVDKSKGVTFVTTVSDEGEVPYQGINLNGNSVIIKESANSTDTVSYINIYIDKNGDGIADAEEIVSHKDNTGYFKNPADTDFITQVPIYGVYEAKTEEPVKITVQSGTIGLLYGVYNGMVDSKNTTEAGVCLDIKDAVVNTVFAVYASDISATSGTAVDMHVNDAVKAQTIMGVYGTEKKKAVVSGGISINATGKEKPTSMNISSCYVTNSYVNVTGDVKLDLDKIGIGNFYGIYGGTTITGNVTVDLDNAIFGNCSAVSGASSVTGGVTLTVQSSTVQGMLNGVTEGSSASGDVAVTTASSTISSMYAVNNGSTTEGNASLTSNGDTTNGMYVLNYGSKVGKDVVISVTGGTHNSIYGCNDGTMVKEKLTVTIDETATVRSCIYGIYNSSIGGNVLFDIYGNSGNSSYLSVYGAYGTGSVGGSFDFNYHGGNANYVYAFNGSYQNSGSDYVYPSIGGYAKAVFDKTSVIAYNLYGFYNVDIKGDCTVSLTGTSIGYMTAAQSASYTDCMTIGGDLTVTMDDTCRITSSSTTYGSNTVEILGGFVCDIRATVPEESTYYPSFYGAYCTKVGKDMSIQVLNGKYRDVYGCYGQYNETDYSLKGAYTFLMKNCMVNYSVYGAQNLKAKGNIDIDILGIGSDSTNNYSGYIYGIYESAADGITDINIDGISNVYGLYGLSGYSEKGTYNSDVTITMKNITAQNYVYGTSGGIFRKNLVIALEAVKSGSSMYDTSNSTTVEGNLTVSNTDIGELEGTTCYFNGVNYSMIKGKTDISLTNASFSASYFSATSSLNVLDDVTIKWEGGTIGANNIVPYNTSSNGTGDTHNVTVDIKGVTFTSEQDNTIMQNYISDNAKLVMNIDDKTVIPDTMSIYPGYYSNMQKVVENDLTAVATYKNRYYCSGMYIPPQAESYELVSFSGSGAKLPYDIKAKKIQIENSQLYIPEGVTLEATEEMLEIKYSQILLEGKLRGNFYTNPDTGKVDTVSIYMNGGTIDTNTEGLENCYYYPVSLQYMEKGGAIVPKTLYSHVHAPEKQFGLLGNVLNVECTPKRGYTLAGAQYKYEGDASYSQNTTTGASGVKTNISFDIKDIPLDIEVLFKGIQIVVGKTASDPVAKLGNTYTEEQPLYDMASLVISNDGDEGEVTYELQSSNNLPEGLTFENGKIIGKPTVAYEDGKKVTFKVTGKNGTVANVVLNIIVSAEDKTQISQEGRILIDDADENNKSINLLGNSVVIEAVSDTETAIYLDENRDGIKDCDTPIASGDFSRYNLYGLSYAKATKPMKVTITGGKFNNIYGAFNSSVTGEFAEDAVSFTMTGGTASYVYTLYNSQISGEVFSKITNDVNKTYYYCNSNSTYQGMYNESSDYAEILKGYTVKNDITVRQLGLYSSGVCLTIPKDMTVTVSTLGANYYTNYIYLKGKLVCDNGFYDSNGRILVQGGEITKTDGTDVTYKNVYYPLSMSADMEGKKISGGSGVITRTEDGESVSYGMGGTDIILYADYVAGYSYYYSVNGGEEKESVTSTITVPMPRKVAEVYVQYVPTNISLKETFEAPVGYVGTEYTDAMPLYDYGTLDISGDTSKEYGTDVVYELKKGCVLPEGLSLVDGKVIGTPTKAVEEGTPITITVTGRNGTTADITMDYVIKADPDTVTSLEKVEYKSGRIYLNGTSVVVYADPANSSRVKLYLDANHDGIADNSKAYTIEGGTDSFSYPTIYGYTDAENPFDGDISINIKNALVGEVYGIYGTNDGKVTVNGNVDVRVRGGTLTGVAAGYYGSAKALSLHITGGQVRGTVVTAAYGSEASTVNYEFTGTASYVGSNVLSAVDSSTIEGNVNCNVGTKSGYGLGSNSYTKYYGIYNSVVGGDVTYDINGVWGPTNTRSTGNMFAYKSTIAGDMNVNWHEGRISCGNSSVAMKAFLSESSVKDLNIIADENADIGSSYFNGLCQGSIENVYVKIPDSVSGTFSFNVEPSNFADLSDINGDIFIENKRAMVVKGNHTITEDCTLDTLEVYPDSVVTIAEGVTVTQMGTATNNGTIINNGTWNLTGSYAGLVNNEGASFVNNGKFNTQAYVPLRTSGVIENYGELTNEYTSGTSAYVTIYDTGVFVNHRDATWNVGARVNNLGIIYNYGNLKQTYHYSSSYASLGKLIAGTTPDYYYADRYYANTYYPVTLDYTDYCASNVTLTDSTGAELEKGYGEDTNVYLRATTGFKLVVDGVMDNINLKSVTYNYNGTQKNASTSDSVTWTGTIYYEPVTIKIEFSEIEGAKIITITPDNDVIESIKVGENNNSFYNVGSSITVENDTDIANAYITFEADPNHPLPEGLYVQQRTGRIYGTPTHASDEPIVSVIKVKGKNQSVTNFTLTFNKVEKGTPKIPETTISAVAGTELSTIAMPSGYSVGVFEAWVDDTLTAPSVAGEVAAYDVYFKPSDTVNYDWSTVANGTWDAEKGVATGKINIKANKIYPEYTVPEQIDATYGLQYKDVELPSDENGKYIWQNCSEEYVGTVGTYYQYIQYVPANEDMYYTVSYIRVKVVVGKAKAEGCETFDYLEGETGDKIGDIALPEAEGGTYQWKTLQSTVVVSGNEYEVVFKPADMINYDWSDVPGYSNAYKGVVFKVVVELFAPENKDEINISALPVELSADYGQKLSEIPLPKRSVGNWYVNGVRVEKPLIPAEGIPNGSFVWTDESLVVNTKGEFSTTVSYVPDNPERYTAKENIPVTITVVHAHTIVIDKAVAPTCTEQGLSEGKHCSVCDEVILAQKPVPALGHAYDKGVVTKEPTATEKGEKTYTCTRCKQTKKEAIPVTGNTNVPAEKGKVIQAKGVNGNFKVTSSDAKAPKVSYAGPSNKAATAVNVPSYITVNGVKYEVTEIADNAFKKNKTLTKITIPKTVIRIGKNAFYACTKLKTVSFAKGSALKKIDSKAFYKCTALTSFTVQSKVTTIGTSAFAGCKKLKKLKLGSRVTKIGTSAFSKCTALTTVTIPKKVTSIGKNAFYGCTRLKTVKFAKGSKLKKIDGKAFYKCKSLKSFVVQAKVTTIGANTFYGCSKLKTITIKSKVLKKVGKNAIKGIYKKAVIKVPKAKRSKYKKLFNAASGFKKPMVIK